MNQNALLDKEIIIVTLNNNVNHNPLCQSVFN